jgi:hypothetical protein
MLLIAFGQGLSWQSPSAEKTNANRKTVVKIAFTTIASAGLYHFAVAMWRTKTAESGAYENDNSPIKQFDEALVFAGVPSHSIRARLLCAFAASASGLPRRLLNEPKHRPR